MRPSTGREKTASYDPVRREHRVAPGRPYPRLAYDRQGRVIRLRTRGETFAIVAQTTYEFWAAASRPLAVNGLGLTVPACQTEIARLRTYASFLPDQPTLFAEWESLVVTQQFLGKVSHDARLVAAMRTNGLTQILTFNIADFRRYPGLTVIDPAAP